MIWFVQFYEMHERNVLIQFFAQMIAILEAEENKMSNFTNS